MQETVQLCAWVNLIDLEEPQPFQGWSPISRSPQRSRLRRQRWAGGRIPYGDVPIRSGWAP